MHVIYPCQSHSATIPFIQAVEGTPLLPAPGGFVGHGHDGQASSSNQGRGRGGGRSQARDRRKNQTPYNAQQNVSKPWKAKHWQGSGKDGKNHGKRGKGGKGQGKEGKGGKGGGKDGKPFIQK